MAIEINGVIGKNADFNSDSIKSHEFFYGPIFSEPKRTENKNRLR